MKTSGEKKKKLYSGVYLVIDPSYGEEKVLRVVESSMKGGLDALQLWAAWNNDSNAVSLGQKLAELANSYTVPFLVNNNLEVARKIGADGVHVDGFEPSPVEIRKSLGEEAIVGITCSTSMEKVLWAAEKVNYISFCSMFPSPSVKECDLVPLSMLVRARKEVSIPIFASGGISLSNAAEVIESGADGVAVISTIMNSNHPELTTRDLKQIVVDSRAAREEKRERALTPSFHPIE